MKAGVTVIAVLLFIYFAGSRHRAFPSGVVLVPQEPTQTPTVDRTWDKGRFKIIALARFRIDALVISTERYWFDLAAELSPVDFALGWGPLSDSAVADRANISQGGRWYRYRASDRSMQDEIARHSANMHMIPADAAVERQLKSVAPGDVVSIAGYLVEADAAKGFKWRSSLTRTDTGPGACELVWVEEVSRREP